MFCCPSKKKTAGPVEAGIANGALVVSSTGTTPRIWRANLAVARTAAIELQEAPNAFRVVMKSTGAPDDEIAAFKDRESALAAFQAITEALMSDDQVVQAARPRKGGFFRTLFKIVLWLVGLFVGGLVLLSILLKIFGLPSLSSQLETRVGQEMQKIQAQRGMPAPPAAPAERTGVPVPADQLFGE